MGTDDSLYIIMPVYNEQGALPNVLDQWYPIVEQSPQNRLVVLNDGSTDNTMEIISEYAHCHPQVVGINKENSGHGATIYDGYVYALDHGASYVFQTDSDGQTSPDEFADFWHKMLQDDALDAVFGNRNHRQDGPSRVFVTKVLKLVIKCSMGGGRGRRRKCSLSTYEG